jgi:prepilin-type N-terminal cleavage/methylation domain-containing protein
MQRGFSLIELLVVMATVAVLMAIAIPLFQDALLRANTSSLSTDAKALYVAIKQYYVDNNTYPTTAAFDTATFEPLVGMGYYSGRVMSRLLNEEADGYLGSQDEFWLEMTLKVDPSVRFLISDSQNSPLGGGAFLDGVYLYVDGELREIGQLK